MLISPSLTTQLKNKFGNSTTEALPAPPSSSTLSNRNKKLLVYSLGSLRTSPGGDEKVGLELKVEAYPPRIYRQCRVTLKVMVELRVKTNEVVLMVPSTKLNLTSLEIDNLDLSGLKYSDVTLATTWPGFDLKDSVQVSSYHLNNTGINPGEDMKLIKLVFNENFNPNSAILSIAKITVCLSNSTQTIPEELKPYILQLLNSLEYICPGTQCELYISGKATQFSIDSIEFFQEEQIVTIHSNDKLLSSNSNLIKIGKMSPESNLSIVDNKPTEIVSIQDSYDKIGGLKKQIAEIRAIIELPLGPNRKIFSDNGLKLPRGLLLFGPPGTGKTLIAKAAAHSAGITPLLISAPELMSRYIGETENKIKEIFNKARETQPSIICFDEIDSLCPRRDKSQSEMEKRTVATFLTLMDGIGNDSDELVMVIGTTNRPHIIDPALRRPGRFDTEIEIGIPDREERFEILEKLLCDSPNTISPLDLRSISDRAHGYVGADLAVLVKEAGLSAIRRHIADFGSDVGSDDVDIHINNQDLESAFGVVRPSAMREVAVEVPKVYWNEIGGQHEIRQKLREAIEWPLKHPEIFQQFGIRPPRGVLLYGPPGCSKTLMAKALATEAQVNFLLVKGPELFNQWVGESEKAVREIFRKARAAAPAIIFLDEIDALTVKRGSSSSVAERVLAQFLTEMDGIDVLNNVTVVGATNRPDIIDPALLRPGRIDRLLYVGAPDAVTREDIFRIQSRKMPFASNVNFTWLSDQTHGCSGAEVVGLCQNAAMVALENDLHALEISHEHFQEVIDRGLVRGITPDMINFFNQFQDRSQSTRI